MKNGIGFAASIALGSGLLLLLTGCVSPVPDMDSMRDRASQGDAQAQYDLGMKYARGKGVVEDDAEAIRWLRQAAEQGHAKAQTNLGGMYINGEDVPQDYVEAIKWLRRATEQGNAKAQFLLASRYAKGEGVPQDKVEAVKWARRAAEQGFARAQNTLGTVYAHGDDVPRDEVEAVRWFRRAAEQGFASAQVNLGTMYAKGKGVPQDDMEAVQWVRLAAEQGDARAQSVLGTMYAQGKGVPQDYVEAVQWFRRAAEQGDARAQNNLGNVYANGEGVPRDDAQAVQWYRLAAEQGNAKAQNNLGNMYANGWGVLEDDGEAIKWYRRAAAQGHAFAQDTLGRMYVNDDEVPQDDGAVAAVRHYSLGGDHGQAKTSDPFGAGYAKGEGAPRDAAQAVQRVRRAAEQGDVAAQALVNMLYFMSIAWPDEYAARFGWSAEPENADAHDLFWVETVPLLRSAEPENADVHDRLNDMVIRNEGVREDTETQNRVRQAEEEGDATTQVLLGAIDVDDAEILENFWKAIPRFNFAGTREEYVAKLETGFSAWMIPDIASVAQKRYRQIRVESFAALLEDERRSCHEIEQQFDEVENRASREFAEELSAALAAMPSGALRGQEFDAVLHDGAITDEFRMLFSLYPEEIDRIDRATKLAWQELNAIKSRHSAVVERQDDRAVMITTPFAAEALEIYDGLRVARAGLCPDIRQVFDPMIFQAFAELSHGFGSRTAHCRIERNDGIGGNVYKVSAGSGRGRGSSFPQLAWFSDFIERWPAMRKLNW